MCQDFWPMQWCIDFVKFRARLRAGWCLTFLSEAPGDWDRYVKSSSRWLLVCFNGFPLCDVGSILEILEGRDYSNKPFTFAIPVLECNRDVIFFVARFWGSEKFLHTALYIYINNFFVSFFTYDLLLFVLAKAFFIILGPLLSKIIEVS